MRNRSFASGRIFRWIIPGMIVVGLVVAFVPRSRSPDRPRSRATDTAIPSVPRSQPVAPEARPAPVVAEPHTVFRGIEPDLPVELRDLGFLTIEDAFAGIARLPDGPGRQTALIALLVFCGERRANREALKAALELEEETLREFAITFLVRNWSERDPEAALAWAAEHPRGANDNRRYQDAFEGFAARDPGAALRRLQDPALTGDLDALSRIVIFHFDAPGRLAEARSWIEQLPAGDLREMLILQVVNHWAVREPEATATWLAGVASRAAFSQTMDIFFQSLAGSDPESAAQLTQQFSERSIREGNLADVIYLWARKDAAAAGRWVGGQTRGPHLDGAIARLVDALAASDRDAAVTWIVMISDPDLRATLRARLGVE